MGIRSKQVENAEAEGLEESSHKKNDFHGEPPVGQGIDTGQSSQISPEYPGCLCYPEPEGDMTELFDAEGSKESVDDDIGIDDCQHVEQGGGDISTEDVCSLVVLHSLLFG